MNTNWKRLVAQANADTFVLPPGWTPRDEVAEQLGCSVERVAEHMRPLMAAKPPRAEGKDFDVWDDSLGRKVRVRAYREIKPAKAAAPLPTTDRGVTIMELRKAGKSWSQVGAALGVCKSVAMRAGRKAGVR